jgi:NDP-sugar pyrophosphorylase family protein
VFRILKVMKAIIFAAGKGTRLKPFTDTIPKALVEINGVTLLETTIKKLILFGFNEIIINVHHFADQVIEFLKEKNNFGIRIEISDERDLLLDTGGGLKKASKFFDDNKPFLAHNVDIISNVNLKDMYEFHINSNVLATVAVKDRESQRYFLFNEAGILSGWGNTKTNEEIITRPKSTPLTKLAFSGIHVINPAIFSLMPEENVFSITNFYLNLSCLHNINAYKHDETFWIDLGKVENLKYFTGMD